MAARKTAEERFRSKIGPPTATGCTEWPLRSRDRDGYGRFTVDGREVGAHRFAWELANGPVPPGLWVLHHCDNPPCVNPEHLYVGTQADNMTAAARRYRLSDAQVRHANLTLLAKKRGGSG